MTVKAKAVEMLGERALALPAMVTAALMANDRIKYLFSVLQAARMHGDRPHEPIVPLDAERKAAGIATSDFDEIAADSGLIGPGLYAIPRFESLRRAIVAEMETMLLPFAGEGCDEAGLAARFAPLLEALMSADCAAVPAALIDTLTATDRKVSDSLHLLVMDAHKALNRLQTLFAEESIDGAVAYGLIAADRPLVGSFMRGLSRTGSLKFDHPGLGTTATRAGERLVIQNDIGTTDAHVMVIHVDTDAIRLTYSDVHLARLSFFCDLFPAERVAWQAPQVQEVQGFAQDRPFYVVIGAFPAAELETKASVLDLIGSRLVFLIDWNKARKRLLRFLDNDGAVALLRWAADEDVGHRGFLQLGGEHLVFDAVEAVSGGQVRYGESLQDMVGHEEANLFLRFVLRAASSGLLLGRSEALIRDQIRAELLNHFHSRERQLFDLATDHAAFTLQIADAVREAVSELGSPAETERLGRRAKRWERSADERLMALRDRAHGKAEALAIRRIVEMADDAADDLEEAAYAITLYPGAPPAARCLQPLRQLAALLVEAAREWVKAVAAAASLQRRPASEQADDFLVSIDALARLERDTDRAQRRVTVALIADSLEYREFYLIIETARHLERAADALMRAGMMMHDNVLGRMMQR